MTKIEMVREMMADIRWTEFHKEQVAKQIVSKRTSKRITEVYNFWTENKDKSYFCIGVL